MGSEVIPAIVLRRPLGPSLPLLLLFLVFFTVASCAGQDDFEDEVPDDSTRLRPHQIQELKRRVLQGLGLSRFPDVSKMNVSQEEYERMHRLYVNSVQKSRRRRLKHGSQQPTEQRFFTFPRQESPIRGHYPPSFDMETLNFNVEIPEAKHGILVQSATLRFLVSGMDSDGTNSEFDIRVYQLLDSNTYKGKRNLLNSQRINIEPNTVRWADMTVTSAVNSWLHGESVNYGFQLECANCRQRGVNILIRHENSSLVPVLNVLAEISLPQLNITHRFPRDASSESHLENLQHVKCEESGAKCCRRSYIVNFNQVPELKFILQPTFLDLGYCKGRCPPMYNPAHYHALLQSLIWRNNKKGQMPRPCCAPSKLDFLEILYADEHNNSKLKVVKWTNVSLVECACS